MPELPEVETTCRGIAPHTVNTIIESVIIREHRLRWPIVADFAKNIMQQKITAVSRRAKYIIIHLQRGHILIHLGMSGHLQIINSDRPLKKHDHVDILLSNSLLLRYHDPRRFGVMLWYEHNHPLLQHLGPEPLSADFSANYLEHKAVKRNVAIKNFIMDNKIVVGVGNIYASESLFLAKIHPLTPASQLSLTQFENLVTAIQQVLTQAITQGGTTLKDFFHSDGKPGYFANNLQVYGRADQACYHCNTPIKSIVIGQRNSYYCAQCQT